MPSDAPTKDPASSGVTRRRFATGSYLTKLPFEDETRSTKQIS